MTDSDGLDRALERLLADTSPRHEVANLPENERQMVRMAQLLRGMVPEGMSPGFEARMRAQLSGRNRPITRRTAFLSGLGAAAAAAAAALGLKWLSDSGHGANRPPLVGAHGAWHPVIRLAELPEGTIYPFTAGSVQGFLLHRQGRVYALSRICTHMGCALHARPREGILNCPCHGAQFDLNGHLLSGPGYGYGYGITLPPLPSIRTRLNGGAIEVWAV